MSLDVFKKRVLLTQETREEEIVGQVVVTGMKDDGLILNASIATKKTKNLFQH